MSSPIVVIGAGICGVSTAIWLQRSGHDVVLLDKGEPGMGASYGNAGLLAHWAVDPVTSPRLWRDAPRFLMSPNGPLFLQWSYLPTLLPWLIKFLSNTSHQNTQRIVKNLNPLLYDTVDQHRSLTRDTALDKWIVNSKFSYVYNSHKDFMEDKYSWDLKARVGLQPTVLTGNTVHEEEPILNTAIQCLATLEGQGHVTNPGQYVTELCKHFSNNGGTFIRAEVKDIHKVNGCVSHVDTNQGRVDCRKLVITSGIWSKELMQKIGLSIPMETERGYHLVFENPSQTPRNPMIIAAGKFGVTPMDTGLRCAGTVELASHKTKASNSPVKMLRHHAKHAFPNLQYTSTQEWMGFRPTPPDSTPLIGELGHTGIYTGFGHQHIGLTAGPKTGRLLAQLINNEKPNVDMTPYSPERYT